MEIDCSPGGPAVQLEYRRLGFMRPAQSSLRSSYRVLSPFDAGLSPSSTVNVTSAGMLMARVDAEVMQAPLRTPDPRDHEERKSGKQSVPL